MSWKKSSGDWTKIAELSVSDVFQMLWGSYSSLLRKADLTHWLFVLTASLSANTVQWNIQPTSDWADEIAELWKFQKCEIVSPPKEFLSFCKIPSLMMLKSRLVQSSRHLLILNFALCFKGNVLVWYSRSVALSWLLMCSPLWHN